MFDKIADAINPRKNPDLTQAQAFQREHLPTLWLLGKTGAGKSSFIQAITGLSSVEVGNGFAPCTMNSQSYDFPIDSPVMRFLDTRGLGEADYDPTEDLEKIGQLSNAVVVVMKVDEPEQSAVLSALNKIKSNKKIEHLLLVHSGFLLAKQTDRDRLVKYNEKQVADIWGQNFASVCVDFECADGEVYNRALLISELTKILPLIALLVDESEHASIEEKNFNKLKSEVLWYAGSASASDLIPAVGLVSVPAIQAKMLHSLANQYGVEWNKRTWSELIGTLGSGFALQYSVKLGARQLVKFIPGYGQTVGAVAAATMSFGTTYGLGRAACYYFYHKSKGAQVSAQEMQNLYKTSLDKGKEASGYASN